MMWQIYVAMSLFIYLEILNAAPQNLPRAVHKKIKTQASKKKKMAQEQAMLSGLCGTTSQCSGSSELSGPRSPLLPPTN